MSVTKGKNIPLWLDVSKKIEEDIDSGKYAIGQILPCEFELCNIYNVSRITVRGALARLDDLGRIKRIKGKGTVVIEAKINEPLLKIEGFSEEMRHRGLVPTTSYAHIERKSVSGYVAELFGKSKSTLFNVLERVRCINGIPVGYFVTYFADNIKLNYDDKDYYSSLYEKLDKELGIKIDYVNQVISADLADTRTRQMLGLSAKDPVLVMKRKAYTNGVLVEYSVCKYNAQRYEYIMELNK